jgi:hypothetical protein
LKGEKEAPGAGQRAGAAEAIDAAGSAAGSCVITTIDDHGETKRRSETSRTNVVNQLSEFSTEGGPIRWTVDYVSAAGRLIAAVRPADGSLSLYALTVTKSGTGTGRVTAVQAGVECQRRCAGPQLEASGFRPRFGHP